LVDDVELWQHTTSQVQTGRRSVGREALIAERARIALLRVADRAGFVDFFAGQADIGGRRFPAFRLGTPGPLRSVPALGYLAPFLRRVVFVCKAALRGGFTTFAPAATAKLN